MSKLYMKDSKIVSVGDSFMYETFVYLRTKLSCMVVNSAIFISEKEINNVVEYFRKSPHIEINSQLIEAPEQWLLDNGYFEYQIPEKIKRVRKTKPKEDV